MAIGGQSRGLCKTRQSQGVRQHHHAAPQGLALLRFREGVPIPCQARRRAWLRWWLRGRYQKTCLDTLGLPRKPPSSENIALSALQFRRDGWMRGGEQQRVRAEPMSRWYLRVGVGACCDPIGFCVWGPAVRLSTKLARPRPQPHSGARC